MFDLKDANINIRKAVAKFHHIRSGKTEFVYEEYNAKPTPSGDGALYARVTNRNFPGGLNAIVTSSQIEIASKMTWREINGR